MNLVTGGSMTADAEITNEAISVLLLEDLGSARELYSRWLQDEGFVVTAVRSLETLEREASRSHPDVALVDVNLRQKDDVDGFKAAAIIKRASPETAVAIFTSYGEDVLKEHLPRVLGYVGDLPAEETFDGVLLKDMSTDEIARAIRELDARGAFIASQALRYTKPSSLLTERERHCIDGLCSGLNRTDLERELHIATKTVQRAIASAKEKLGVTGGDAELVKVAYSRRIISG
jgi:DNA-binding NarL/FixJ family response regulator